MHSQPKRLNSCSAFFLLGRNSLRHGLGARHRRAVHALEIDTPATDQTGRSGTEVRFPIDLINEGNVRDTVGLSVVSQTASPRWGTSFETEDGMPMTEIDVDPQTTTTVYLVVSIDGEEELENSRVTVRVRNKDDPNGQDRDGDGIPDNQRQGTFLAVLSDRNFSMDLRLENTDTATTGSIILPPSGQQTVGMWVKNTGDGNDDAVFTLGGLEGIATRSMLVDGLPVTDALFVPKGYGIWSNLTESFVLDNETQEPLIETTYEGADNLRYTRSLVDNHVVREFEIYVELTLSVNPGAETGQGGLLEILVTSESNAADRSGLETISLEVSIVHERRSWKPVSVRNRHRLRSACRHPGDQHRQHRQHSQRDSSVCLRKPSRLVRYPRQRQPRLQTRKQRPDLHGQRGRNAVRQRHRTSTLRSRNGGHVQVYGFSGADRNRCA